MNEQEALWSAPEVRTQAAQCPGQVTVWDALSVPNDLCTVCGRYNDEAFHSGCWHER